MVVPGGHPWPRWNHVVEVPEGWEAGALTFVFMGLPAASGRFGGWLLDTPQTIANPDA